MRLGDFVGIAQSAVCGCIVLDEPMELPAQLEEADGAVRLLAQAGAHHSQ